MGPTTTCARPTRRTASTIAYCSDVSGSWEIWSMKQNGTKQHQVTHLGGFSTFPDYSPDGSKIAFVSQLGHGLE